MCNKPGPSLTAKGFFDTLFPLAVHLSVALPILLMKPDVCPLYFQGGNPLTKLSRNEASLRLCRLGMLVYTFWLMLPAVQITGRAITGILCSGLFVLGLILDFEEWRMHWKLLTAQAAAAIAMPLILFFFLDRGAGSLPGFFARNLMLWLPLIFVSYAKRKADPRLWKGLKIMALATMGITTLTTIGWLIQGLFVENLWHTYPRMLGSGLTDGETLKGLMRRNIGGYDFIYAAVLTLPLLCGGIQHSKGWKRAGLLLFLLLEVIMIVMSEYTYAIVYTAVILLVEFTGLIIRRVFKLSLGKSLLAGLIPLAILFLLRIPLIRFASDLFGSLGMASVGANLEKLLQMLEGVTVSDGNRLVHYQEAWAGFTASPFIGSVLSPEKRLSQHSELLDLLSGVGLLGTLAVGGLLFLLHRGAWNGTKKSASFPHLVLMGLTLVVIASLGTAFYSREMFVVYAAGLLFFSAQAEDVTPSAGPGEGSSGTLPSTTE